MTTPNQGGTLPVEKSQEQYEQEVANRFDPEAFKSDLMQSNKALLESAISTMKTIVDTGISTVKNSIPATPTTSGSSKIDAELKEEMNALGLDEAGAAAITGIIYKIINKVTPDQETKLLSKVDQSLDNKDKKALYEQKIKTRFPQFYDTNSPLFAQTKQEFSSMTDEERASPSAAWNAVTRAALELGIQPAQLPNAGSTFVDGGGKPAKDPSKLTKEENDFASFFGVDLNKYKDARKGQTLN